MSVFDHPNACDQPYGGGDVRALDIIPSLMSFVTYHVEKMGEPKMFWTSKAAILIVITLMSKASKAGM